MGICTFMGAARAMPTSTATRKTEEDRIFELNLAVTPAADQRGVRSGHGPAEREHFTPAYNQRVQYAYGRLTQRQADGRKII
jgi:hypothetical protein